jgi:hypothetical protein
LTKTVETNHFLKNNQQMGAAVSTNIAKTSADVITKVTNNVVENLITNLTSQEIIQIENVTGNVDIENINQTASATVNMTALYDALANTDVKENLSLEMAQAAKALVKDINFGNISDATNDVEAVISSTIDIASNLQQLCNANINETQTIQVNKVNGNVVVNGINQSTVSAAVSSCALKAISNSTAVNELQAKISQKSEATTAGVSIWGIVAMIGIILVGALLVFGGPVIAPLLVAGKKPIIFGVIFCVISLIFFLIWGLWTKRDVATTLWAIPIDQECIAAVKGEKFYVSSAQEAASKCIENKNADAFDFVAQIKNNDSNSDELSKLGKSIDGWTILDKPYVQLYTQYDKPCKLKNDDSQILTKRKVFVDQTSAPRKDFDVGDVWIDASSAKIQIFKEIGGARLWSSPTQIFPSLNSIGEVNIEGMHLMNPLNNFANTKLSSDPSLITFEVQIGNEIKKVAGPGYVVNSNVKPNASGFIVKIRKRWALYVAIGFLIAGILIVLFLRPKKPKQDIKKKK